MSIELITAEVCPYAQRTHMCLLEKGLEFERREVDLDDKPDWFAEVSPYAKVPVLKDGHTRVFESSIINEYLEDAYPGPRLLPQSAAARAEARIWIDFDNTKLVTTHYRVLLSESDHRRRELAEQLKELLRYISRKRGLPTPGTVPTGLAPMSAWSIWVCIPTSSVLCPRALPWCGDSCLVRKAERVALRHARATERACDRA